jgi:uncharacterized protein with PIN domain
MDGKMDSRLACDAMLGGLARWLRAAGYDAFWQEGIDDSELVHRAQEEGWTVLSSDGDVFAFAVVRDGIVPSLFVPRGLGVQEQLAFVMRRLGLPLCEPRCMACGGELVEAAKETVGDRVPPRSLAHYERFWECASCRRVYWNGTHWRKITERLREAMG